MATRERSILPLLRRLGSIRHHHPVSRDTTAHLLSSPENARRLREAIQRLDEGKGHRMTAEEFRVFLETAE
jgi:hypothetical protein